MHIVLSLFLIAATVFATEWLVDAHLGEDRRHWVGLAGVALLLVGGALVKASGINALTRILRNSLIGAGIGALLNRVGLRLGWLRSSLRIVGVETDPATRPNEALRGLRLSGQLLWLGWAGSMAGMGMVWTGMFAG
jgi:hypothetical protein